MRFNRLQGVVLAVMLLMVGAFVVSNLMPVAHAQSATTGAIAGEVKDPSGAVVPNATVTVTNTGTNATQVVKTNAEGRYTASQLNPGIYTVSATAANLQSSSTQLEVLIGTTVTADVKVSPAGKKETIEVTASTLPLVDTQNVALATTFNETQIADLPAPGGDVTTVAFTAPGVAVNAGGSYGNFSSNGLPGISNLFVLNGFDNQDPFLNLNNSGSSNLTLGQGELAEATVVENGYNSQYGRAAGATIVYTTKSGTNAFHGEADYDYNGTILNANGWFNKHYGSDRPHAVSNEWAANVGGPVIKDKVFFFGDYEGLHYVLPASGLLTFPSTDFASYVMGNIPALSDPLYTSVFTNYTKPPAYATSIPVANGSAGNQDPHGLLGCGAFVAGTPVPGQANTFFGALPTGNTTGSAIPCMTVGNAQANNINQEWLFTGRLDWQVSEKHRLYGRYKMDHGSQPTYTDLVDPLYGALSIQPEYEGQFNDSYVFSPTKTNTFVAAANWYSAYFGPANQAASYAELPMFFLTDLGYDGSGVGAAGGLPYSGVPNNLTQGRNVTQYQFQDDFSWIHGKHGLKFGANFRRDLVEDYDSRINTIFPTMQLLDLYDFSYGQVLPACPGATPTTPCQPAFAAYDNFNQSYTATTTAHLALYNLGVYAQDEWQVNSKLKLTLGLRVDHTGDPLCHGGCFSLYNSGTYPSSSASVTQPYIFSQGGSINPTNQHPFTGDKFNIQPRFGFNYSINDKTEVRGGVGFFSDLYPAGFADGVIQNFPNYNTVSQFAGIIAEGGDGSVVSNAALGNTAIVSGFNTGGSISTIASNLLAANVPFTAPSLNAYFPGKFHTPEYLEFNLQIQRELSKNIALKLNYTGNYGYHEILQNPDLNASSGFYNATGTDDSWMSIGPIAGLSGTPADPSFARITSYTNAAHSNYNGAWIAVVFNGHGLSGQFSYTYGHAMDEISNGGVGEVYNGGSTQQQLTPDMSQLNLNYSNADYDIRNDFTGDLVYNEQYKAHNFALNEILGGWTIALKTYLRSGEPFSIYNQSVANVGYETLGASFMAQKMPGLTTGTLTNTSASDPHSAVLAPALNQNEYYDGGSNPAQLGFGDIRRNSLYGPHYANTDFSLTKSLYHHEKIDFKIGANAYNVFNHANFANPYSTLNGNYTFGTILSTLAPPTSPYGSFQGAAVTQRVLQVHGKIVF